MIRAVDTQLDSRVVVAAFLSAPTFPALPPREFCELCSMWGSVGVFAAEVVKNLQKFRLPPNFAVFYRVACAFPQPGEHFEPAQITNYKLGQLYAAHFDAFDVTNGPGLECAATGGQRVATVLMYLNDCPSGGGTYFPRIDVRVMPKKGKVIVFFPCSIDGMLDPLALHTGEPAVEEKWICQVWIRQTDFVRRVL